MTDPHPVRPDRQTALAEFLAALDLTDTGARTHEDIFTGPSQHMPHGRVFGGQVLAQTVMAAQRTVAADRIIHSMHGYFLRPGDPALPITFAVDRIHDGRSFSARRTQAYQNGAPIFSMIASFQLETTGVEHQHEMPAGIPGPEDLPGGTNLRPIGAHPLTLNPLVLVSPFEFRVVPDLPSHPGEPQYDAIWIKAVGRLPDDPHVHRAALAYASDYTLLASAMHLHGLALSERPGLKVASLDHVMWWHRFARADEWMLFIQASPNTGGGRGLGQGRVYDESGRLLASVGQEGMIRVPAD